MEDLGGVALRRDHHDARLFVGGLGADLVDERHAVHSGHRPVDQDDVDRSELRQEGKRLVPVAGLEHLEAERDELPFEQHPHGA